jgi:hypothetical protein
MDVMNVILKPGDSTRAICDACGVVDARFEMRPYQLSEPPVTVPQVLVAVCTMCDRIVAVPYQSSATLNAARRAARAE